jgi:ATP-dependent DNA helicase RecQ
MDPDRVDEIFEYFKSAETDSIDDALDKLGIDDFSEMEIRLVRIKFLSEVGN